MTRLFGTDGIRGVANRFPMDAETAVSVGRVLGELYGGKGRGVVLGKDTRLSGDMLEMALAAGACSSGAEVYACGVLPTPAVAFLCRSMGAGCGVMISASHNPFDDNGIKVFGADGGKLSLAQEQRIESRILEADPRPAAAGDPGRVQHVENSSELYRRFLTTRMGTDFSLRGVKLVVDCANGATCRIAPQLLAGLGAEVKVLNDQPDGRNINDRCGSQHPHGLRQAVLATGADAGLALDGDGDRLVAVAEDAAVLAGDQILLICAVDLKQRGMLKNNRVVSTVMSNMGLGIALKRFGISYEVSDVGDRFVMQKMKSCGAVLGGEESGHTIFSDDHTTGDGILTALKLLAAMQSSGKPLSLLGELMTRYPQVLINVEVSGRPPLENCSDIQNAIAQVEQELCKEGRVLVRYSGTQPQCRVMVEGPTHERTQACCRRIAAAVERSIGRK